MEGGQNKGMPFEKRSLNKEARRKQLFDITLANQALLRRLQDKKSNYDVMKWEEERVNNEKMVQRIGLFSSQMGESHSKSRALLPTLKNPRQATTRMTKRRIQKNYETEFHTLDPSSIPKKRAKTTRRHKRTLTNTEKDIDITEV